MQLRAQEEQESKEREILPSLCSQEISIELQTSQYLSQAAC